METKITKTLKKKILKTIDQMNTVPSDVLEVFDLQGFFVYKDSHSGAKEGLKFFSLEYNGDTYHVYTLI